MSESNKAEIPFMLRAGLLCSPSRSSGFRAYGCSALIFSCALGLMSCGKQSAKVQDRKAEQVAALKGPLSKDNLSYDVVAAKVRALNIAVQELGEPCREFQLGRSLPEKERKTLPKTVSGVFRHFESAAYSKKIDCQQKDTTWNCRIEVSIPDDYSAQLRFQVDASGEILQSSMECSVAG